MPHQTLSALNNRESINQSMDNLEHGFDYNKDYLPIHSTARVIYLARLALINVLISSWRDNVR